jgi:hypothetical protein
VVTIKAYIFSLREKENGPETPGLRVPADRHLEILVGKVYRNLTSLVFYAAIFVSRERLALVKVVGSALEAIVLLEVVDISMRRC